MRQLIVLLSGLVILLGVAGCQEQQAVQKGVEVNIEGGGAFPQEMVGTWTGMTATWEIVFEANGSISSVLIPQGAMRLVPGEPTIEPMKLGGKGIYEPGVWSVNYIPQSRELMVEIVVDNFDITMADDVLSGNIRYVLTGQVSEDYRLWRPSVVSFAKYLVYIDGSSEPNELPIDPNDTIVDVLFEKIEQ